MTLLYSQALDSKCPNTDFFLVGNYTTFGLNTERYFVSLRIQSERGKIRTRKTPYLDSFHAVRSNEEYWRISDLTTNQTVIFTDVFQRSYFKYLRRHSEPVQSITDVLLKSLNRLNSQEIKKSFIFKRRRSFFTFFEVNF